MNEHSATYNKIGFSKTPQTSLMISKPTNSKPTLCPCCQEEHPITSCRKFEALSVDDRNRCARELGLCYTCLSTNHWANKCRSKTRCGTCQRKHHVLLHGYIKPRQSGDDGTSGETSLCTSAVPSKTDTSSTILLGTALVHVQDRTGIWQTARALVDSASQVSAITVSCSERLGLMPKKWTAPISGLSGTPVIDVKGQVECAIQPRFAEDPKLTVTAWVLPSITNNMPRENLPQRIKDEYSNLALADPAFNVRSSVDLLLGADLFSTILDGRKIVVKEDLPTAFSSIFGWILIGPVLQRDENTLVSAPVSLTVSLENLIEKFWRVEEPEMSPAAFTEDGRCEELYNSECHRMTSGRFNVPFPTRSPVSEMNFPGSREHAIKRFESLERKLSSDAKLKALYSDFMLKYLTLGHMSVAKTTGQYYIPHPLTAIRKYA